MHFNTVSFAALAIAISNTMALADAPLPEPANDVVLTLSGQITVTNKDGQAMFDMAMLESMEPVTFETSTIWTEGPQQFTGVALGEILERVGATGSKLRATAINDYAVQIPIEAWPEGGPILAYLNNGMPMPLREKGPLWLIYPFDQNPAFQTEVIYSRSIWQLDRIIVEN